MRLINVNTLKLEEFHEKVPPYAILSHTWGNDQDEISFRDIEEGNIEKGDVQSIKLNGCCEQAKKDGLGYAWIDTCCIDKTNSVELGEAINSMFQWYRNAYVCYAYLSDVPAGDSPRNSSSKFFSSRWFLRGWTLQELLAPKKLHFYDVEWGYLGSKREMSPIIERITGIRRPFLLGIAALHEASIAQRMSWASKRVTKRKEDIAYCLLGIFGVNMPMIYGEGHQAFNRLQHEIMKTTRDDSILAWGLTLTESTPSNSVNMISAGVLAASPSDFVNCGHIVSREYNTNFTNEFAIVGGCVQISLCLFTSQTGETFGLLNCGPEHDTEKVVGIPLSIALTSGPSYDYIRPQGCCSALLPLVKSEAEAQLIRIRTAHQNKVTSAVSRRNWFYIEESIETDLGLIEVEPPDRWFKDRAMIATANDSIDETIQRTWTRFRPGEGSHDFLVLLEFEMQGSQVEARCHIMISSKDTALKDLAQRFTCMRKVAFGKQSANNGTLSVHVNVERETIAGQPMFVVRLTRIPSLPAVTVDAALELRLIELKIGLVNNMKEEDKIRLEAEGIGRQREKKVVDLEPMRRNLAEVEEEIRKLQNEKMMLIEKLDRGDQEVNELNLREKKVKEQQVELSERRSRTQTRLNELLQNDIDEENAQENGYELIIKLLLATGTISGDSTVNDDQPPLSWAAANGYLGIIKLLLTAGTIRGEARSKDGQTPLHWAASEGHEAVVKLLLEAQDEFDSKDIKYGRTPLSWAAGKGHEAVVKLLLKAQAGVDAKDPKYGRTPLLHAAHNGHEAVVKLLLDAQGEVDSKDTKYGRTPLSWAAGKGHKSVVKLLLENGADIDSKATEDGRTPLLHASHNGHEAVVKLLLDAQAEVDSKDSKYGRTPLLHAARNGHEATVKLLLERGADVDSKDKYGWTPLLHAARNGHEAVVKRLLEKGADLDLGDKHGWTPLARAAVEGYESVVKLLLEKGANIDSKDIKDGWTPLMCAARNGHEVVVKMLLEKGANMDLMDTEFGRTPLMHAAGNGHEAVVKLLLEKGANIDSIDTEDGRTPLLYAAGNGHNTIVELLLEKGADINSKDKYGRTPLFYAAWDGYEAVVKLLLEKGAGLESKDNRNGWTPLLYAARNGHEAVVKLLLEKGANLHSKDNKDGWTPLLFAARNGHEAVVKLLLEEGADIDSKETEDGWTPLLHAARNGHEAVVKLLLEKGADVNSKDKYGWTPLAWAASEGYEAVAKLLLTWAETRNRL